MGLDDPILDPTDDADWTPERGVRRAIVRGALMAAVLAVASGVIAAAWPVAAIAWPLRAMLSFVVAWILFSVVQSAAGMIGTRCTLLAVGFTLAALLSNHLVWAASGVAPVGKPDDDFMISMVTFPAWIVLDHTERVAGARMLWPSTIGLTSLAMLLGVGVTAALRHAGAVDTMSLLSILSDR